MRTFSGTASTRSSSSSCEVHLKNFSLVGIFQERVAVCAGGVKPGPGCGNPHVFFVIEKGKTVPALAVGSTVCLAEKLRAGKEKSQELI